MNVQNDGYPVKQFKQAVKRYCQTLDLRDNPELITEYKKRHSKEFAWPEIIAGIKEGDISWLLVDSLNFQIILAELIMECNISFMSKINMLIASIVIRMIMPEVQNGIPLDAVL